MTKKTPNGTNSALKSESGADLSFQLGTPGTINTPMTTHTVHSMASSVGETYDNYNGDTWKDKDSVASDDFQDGLSFEGDSLNDISMNNTPRDHTPLATIKEDSSVKGSGSSYKAKGDDLGWLQGKDNSISSFLSPYISSKQKQSEVKQPPSTSKEGSGHRPHHHHHHHHENKPSSSNGAVTEMTNSMKGKREYSAHIFLSVVTLLLALSLVVHLSRHHEVVRVVEKHVPIASSSFAGWFSSPEKQVAKAFEDNPSSWMDSITAKVLAKKTLETEKAKKEAEEKQLEIDRLEKSRIAAKNKAAAREIEAKKEREAVLAKAAKEEADRKEAERARRQAEQELADLEAKHAEEEKRHKVQEEKRAKERKEEISRLERERKAEIERMKKEEEDRVLVEAAKKAKAIHEAELKKKRELEAARETEKLAIAKAQAAKDAEKKASRRRNQEQSAATFSWVATVLVLLGFVASAIALTWSPFHSRTLKRLGAQAATFLSDLFVRVNASIADAKKQEGKSPKAKATKPQDSGEASEIDVDEDNNQQWKEVQTPAATKGGRGRSKTPARKAKTPAAKSTAKKRTPARSTSKRRKAPVDDSDDYVANDSRPTPLRRSGRVNHLDTGNYVVD